jgi:phosphoglycolate phosphatase-like HAD superfamily hydrolase
MSSNGEENIRECLKAHGVEECFAFVAGYSRLLGKHRALRRILKEESVPLSQAVYIGDEVRDVLAAQAAGIDMAAVCWGINAQRVLARHFPTHLVLTPIELTQLAEGWIQ